MDIFTYEYMEHFVILTVFIYIVASVVCWYIGMIISGILWVARKLKKHFTKEGKRHE